MWFCYSHFVLNSPEWWIPGPDRCHNFSVYVYKVTENPKQWGLGLSIKFQDVVTIALLIGTRAKESFVLFRLMRTLDPSTQLFGWYVSNFWRFCFFFSFESFIGLCRRRRILILQICIKMGQFGCFDSISTMCTIVKPWSLNFFPYLLIYFFNVASIWGM